MDQSAPKGHKVIAQGKRSAALGNGVKKLFALKGQDEAPISPHRAPSGLKVFLGALTQGCAALTLGYHLMPRWGSQIFVSRYAVELPKKEEMERFIIQIGKEAAQ